MPVQGEYDVIVVLGAALRRDGEPPPALRRRVAHAVRLWQSGAAPHLLFSGGIVRHPPSEAEAMRRLALAAGVPDQRLVLEDASRDTFANARNSAAIMAARNWHRAIVVSDRYHLPRSLMLFRARGLVVAGSAPPAGRREIGTFRWLYLVLREAAALPRDWSRLIAR